MLLGRPQKLFISLSLLAANETSIGQFFSLQTSISSTKLLNAAHSWWL